MSVAAPLSVVRPRATVVRMQRRQIGIPVVDQTGTTTGVPAFFGGIDVYWRDSGESAADSRPSFRKAMLTAHQLVGYVILDDDLIEDADRSLTDFLQGPLGFPGAIAWKEDYAFLRGNGVGQPQGILDAPAAHVVPRDTAGTFTYEDLAEMEAHFMGMNPVWIISQSSKKTLQTLKGPTGNEVYLWGNAITGAPPQLLGHPVVFVDKLPGLGSKGDVMLCDFTYYLLGDREAISSRISTEAHFRTVQTALRFTHRVDGQPWLIAPISLTDQDNYQMSPFVVLGDATS